MLDWASITSFLMFALITSITPGPNNIMLLNSGMHIGFWRTSCHVLGIMTGFGIMLVVIALGGGFLFAKFTWLTFVLKCLGSLFMVYIAWKIYKTPPPQLSTSTNKQPISFVSAALFQIINPKAWVMCIAAVSTFQLSSKIFINAVSLLIIYEITFLLSAMLWVSLGKGLKSFLANPLLFKRINLVLAILLLLSIITEWIN